MTTCRACDKRRTDEGANICRRCVKDLEQTIGDFPALLQDLDVTISRQDCGTGTPLYAMGAARVQIPGVHYEEGTITLPSTPWPFAWDAADLRWCVEADVLFWASRFVLERAAGPVCAHDCGPREQLVPHRPHWSCDRRREADRRLALFRRSPGLLLLDRIDEISRHASAVEIHDQLTYLHRQVERAIDRQTPDVFAGTCDGNDVLVEHVDGGLVPQIIACGAELYAHKGDDEVRCPKCGRTYELGPRLAGLRKQLDDEWAPAQLIADALTTLEEPIKADTLRQWIKRDKALAKRLKRTGERKPYPLVLQVGVDDDGKTPLYRVGDVRKRIDHASDRLQPVRSRKRTRKGKKAS